MSNALEVARILRDKAASPGLRGYWQQVMDGIEKTRAAETEADLVEQHGLEPPRMASMTEAEAKEPVVVGLWQDGSAVLIDGGHRRWFWHKRGINTLRGWAVPYDVWKRFTFDPNGPSIIRYHEDGAMLPQRRAK